MIQVVTEELGMNLDNVEPHMFGTCKKVIVHFAKEGVSCIFARYY
jgi:hypothetical protein